MAEMQIPKTVENMQKGIQDFYHMIENFMNALPGVRGTAFRTEVQEAYTQMLQQMMQHPDAAIKLHSEYVQDMTNLWFGFWAKSLGIETKPVVEPERSDRRFNDKEWSINPYFDFVKQSYLLTSELLLEATEHFAPQDEDKQRKLNYHMNQFVSAMSPSNYAALNPEVINRAFETKGQSLLRGMENMLEDLKLGRVTMTDTSAFEVGKNIAVTPGAVVYENELIQVIQYSPNTDQVQAIPLLIMPPWINKYYILDLTPESSFIKYCVDSGLTTYVISWRNVPKELSGLTWEDYITKGSLAAIDVVRAISGQPKINIIGYCIGGTLLASTLSILKSRKQDYIHRATFFTAMVDFTYAGEIMVFIDEKQVKEREARFKLGQNMMGNELANAFAFLRANDLVWNYVTNNYLMGKDYAPFDLLYWNSDPTNMPGAQYMYYIRNMYLENNLAKPKCLTMLGEQIDVTEIDVPIMEVAAKEDHIAPWITVYKSAQLFKGPVEFVLGASGHIAGIVNPASKNKREFWHGPIVKGQSREDWQANAKNQKGSWWTYWLQWVKQDAGALVAAPKELGSAQYPPIEPAPGRYVVEKVPVGEFVL